MAACSYIGGPSSKFSWARQPSLYLMKAPYLYRLCLDLLTPRSSALPRAQSDSSTLRQHFCKGPCFTLSLPISQPGRTATLEKDRESDCFSLHPSVFDPKNIQKLKRHVHVCMCIVASKHSWSSQVEWLFMRSLTRHRQARDPTLWGPLPSVKVLQVQKIANRTTAWPAWQKETQMIV